MTQPRHEGEVGEERGRLPPHNCALGSKKPRFRDLEPEEDGWGWKIHMESWMGRKTPIDHRERPRTPRYIGAYGALSGRKVGCILWKSVQGMGRPGPAVFSRRILRCQRPQKESSRVINCPKPRTTLLLCCFSSDLRSASSSAGSVPVLALPLTSLSLRFYISDADHLRLQ